MFFDDPKLNQFILEISTYNEHVKNGFVVVATEEESRPYKLGFIEYSGVPQDIKERCNETFLNYFEACEIMQSEIDL
jgi:hypothetical protein